MCKNKQHTKINFEQKSVKKHLKKAFAHQSLEARANLSGREVAGRRDEFHPERHRALAAIGELWAETETLIKAAVIGRKQRPSKTASSRALLASEGRNKRHYVSGYAMLLE